MPATAEQVPGIVADELPLLDDASLPPRPFRKKKKLPATQSVQKSTWRDDAGRLPMTVQFLCMALAGVAAGMMALGVWGCIVWFSASRLGFLAILVGFAVGAAVLWAGGDRLYGRAPAFLAASIAAITLTGSQLVATQLQHQKHLQEFAQLRDRALPVITSQPGLLRMYAEEVIRARLDQDLEIDWSEVDNNLQAASEAELLDHPDVFPQIYPADVWAEAEQLYEGLSLAEVVEKQQEIERQWHAGPASVGPETSCYLEALQTQPQKFTQGDLLYFLFSVLVAFVLAGRLNRRPKPYYPWDIGYREDA